MEIGKILQENPEKTVQLAEIMLGAGLHCVGCGAALFETLEQGMKGHGFDEEKIKHVVTQLNNALKEIK